MAEAILRIYKGLVGRKGFESLRRDTSSEIGRRLTVLFEVANGRLDAPKLDVESALVLMDAMLDAIGLESATCATERSLFALPTLGDPALIGRARDRRAKFNGTSDNLLDWQFQMLVQASAASQGFGQVKDLRGRADLKGSGLVCDFELRKDDRCCELIECKRFHPDPVGPDPTTEHAQSKITAGMAQASKQLEQTATALSVDAVCRHFVADISAYSNSESTANLAGANVKVRGFRQEQVEEILNNVKALVPTGRSRIDKLSLCWRNTIFVNGRVCGINQTVVSYLTPGSESVFDYSGWTVEAYPRETEEYLEWWVSSVSRNVPTIVTTFNNLSSPKTFYTASYHLAEDRPS